MHAIFSKSNLQLKEKEKAGTLLPSPHPTKDIVWILFSTQICMFMIKRRWSSSKLNYFKSKQASLEESLHIRSVPFHKKWYETVIDYVLWNPNNKVLIHWNLLIGASEKFIFGENILFIVASQGLFSELKKHAVL